MKRSPLILCGLLALVGCGTPTGFASSGQAAPLDDGVDDSSGSGNGSKGSGTGGHNPGGSASTGGSTTGGQISGGGTTGGGTTGGDVTGGSGAGGSGGGTTGGDVTGDSGGGAGGSGGAGEGGGAIGGGTGGATGAGPDGGATDCTSVAPFRAAGTTANCEGELGLLQQQCAGYCAAGGVTPPPADPSGCGYHVVGARCMPDGDTLAYSFDCDCTPG
jgi:hypothetical protein